MRKALIVILVVLVVTLPAGYAALNSPWVTERLVRRAFLKFAPAVELREFSVAAQKYFWPTHFEFSDIKLSVALNGRTLSLACSHLELDNIRFPRASRGFDVWINRTDATYDLGRAKNARADLKIVLDEKKGFAMRGPVSVQLLAWDQLSAQNVNAQFLADSKGLYFDRLKGEAFRGSFAGGADVFYSSPPAYNVRLTIKDLDTDELSMVSPQIVEQMSGRIAGELNIDGAGDRLTDVLADLSMPSGGRVNASFLATLTQYLPSLSTYLPSAQEKTRFDALIRSGGKLAVEVLSFWIKNDSPHHLAAALSLASKEANINWNLTYDINVDGTWDDLLRSWQAIFK
jgi:hypothetical protein